jgi:hypothetical protein
VEHDILITETGTVIKGRRCAACVESALVVVAVEGVAFSKAETVTLMLNTTAYA